MTKLTFYLALLLCAGCTAVNAAAQMTKVSDDLWKKVQKDGSVKVLVALHMPIDRDQKMSSSQLIEIAQEALIAELSGTRFTVNARFHQAGIAVEVGPDALKILDRSSRVTNVVENAPEFLRKNRAITESYY